PQVVVCVEGLQRKIDRTAEVTQESIEAQIDEALVNSETPGGITQRTVSNPFVTPNEGLEETLANLWQETIGVDSVGAEDNFFELGGNSLVAVQLASRVRAKFQV